MYRFGLNFIFEFTCDLFFFPGTTEKTDKEQSVAVARMPVVIPETISATVCGDQAQQCVSSSHGDRPDGGGNAQQSVGSSPGHHPDVGYDAQQSAAEKRKPVKTPETGRKLETVLRANAAGQSSRTAQNAGSSSIYFLLLVFIIRRMIMKISCAHTHA